MPTPNPLHPALPLRLGAVAILALLAGCSDSPTGPGNAVRHFTVIEPLSADSLAALTARFEAMNPHLCSSLNVFGYPSGVCVEGAMGLPPDAELPALIASIKQEVVRNAEFTGVADTAELAVSRAWTHSGYINVTFADQRWQGLDVRNTVITVRADSSGLLSLNGNHFPVIKTLPTDRISARAAQSSLVGLEIPWYDFGGRRQIYTVTWDSFFRDPEKVVYPRWRRGAIELRVTWCVWASGWKIFVDTTSGEQVGIEQLFVT